MTYISRHPPIWAILLDKYTTFCTVEADLTSVPRRKKKNTQGGIYYEVDWEVVLFFGLTEIKAQIAWKDTEVMQFCYFERFLRLLIEYLLLVFCFD